MKVYVKFLINLFNISFLKVFFTFLAIITFLYCIITFFFMLILSFRVAGSVHAFGLFIQRLKEDPDADLKLRKNDYFKELEEFATEVKSIKSTESANKK